MAERESSFERGFTQEGLLGEEGLDRALRFCFAKFSTYLILIVIAADESNNSIACWDTRSTELQKTLSSGTNKMVFLFL